MRVSRRAQWTRGRAGQYARGVLYRTTRNLYQRLLNREEWQERMARRSLFRRYVAPGELAFDVGAHRGHYAETLREIGARVVAVEANPDLAAEIRRHFPGLVVEETAVGRKELVDDFRSEVKLLARTVATAIEHSARAR